MTKSSKRSRSKGNSLPPTKRFDFTIVDDDVEELQCSFVPKETNAGTKKCVKLLGQRGHSSSAGLLRMRSGIQKMSQVKVADNSPAATPYRIPPKCIHVYGKKNANVGDKVLLAVRGEMKRAVVVATKVPVHGTHPRVRFDDNFVVLLNNKDEPVGTRIKVPLPSTLRRLSHRYNKVLALAKKFV